MSANSNAARQPRLFKCNENDPRCEVALWIINGASRQVGMNTHRILYRFKFGQREVNGRYVRPVAELSDAELNTLSNIYGIDMNPAETPGYWHPSPATPFSFDSFGCFM